MGEQNEKTIIDKDIERTEYNPHENLKAQVEIAKRNLKMCEKRLALFEANPGVLEEFLRIQY